MTQATGPTWREGGAASTRIPILALVLVAPLSTPTVARAWTDANVQSVTANVDVDRSAHANVDLVLTVRIGGGWLSGIDVDGLDPDLVLSEAKPPWAMSADDPTQTWSPRVRVREDGRIRLRFPDRGSPRRGTLLIGLSYATELGGRGTTPVDDGRVRVSWTLPGWRAGLDGVEVTLTTPAGAEAAPSMQEGSEAADAHDADDRDGRSVHVFRRIHLPRTVPWTISVDLPAETLDPALRGPTVAAPPPIASASTAPEDGHGALVLVLLVLLVSLASRASFASACRARGTRPRPLVPGPVWLVAPGAASLAGLGLHFASREPLATVSLLVAVALSAIQRLPEAPTVTPTDWVPVSDAALRAAERERRLGPLAGSPLLDLTTLAGVVGFLALASSAVVLFRAFGSATTSSALMVAAIGLSAIPFAAATRFHLPPNANTALLALRDFAHETRLAGVGLRLIAGVDETGRRVPRLRLALTSAAPGLRRLDVVAAPSPVLGGFELRPTLLVTTVAGSAAEARLAEAPGIEPAIVGPNGLRARTFRLDEEADARVQRVAALLEVASADADAPLLAAA